MFDLRGKTIGIVGCGHIGRRVARIAKGFGMKVLAHDPAVLPDSPSARGLELVSLADLLARADVTTLHAAPAPQTHHLIGQHNIREMKRGSLLINTADGSLVDTEALLSALDDGTLAGAGLDVLDREELLHENGRPDSIAAAGNEHLRAALHHHLIRARANVVITPHTAGVSRESQERIALMTVRNIRAFRRGSCRNVVCMEGSKAELAAALPPAEHRSCSELAGIRS